MKWIGARCITGSRMATGCNFCAGTASSPGVAVVADLESGCRGAAHFILHPAHAARRVRSPRPRDAAVSRGRFYRHCSGRNPAWALKSPGSQEVHSRRCSRSGA